MPASGHVLSRSTTSACWCILSSPQRFLDFTCKYISHPEVSAVTALFSPALTSVGVCFWIFLSKSSCTLATSFSGLISIPLIQTVQLRTAFVCGHCQAGGGVSAGHGGRSSCERNRIFSLELDQNSEVSVKVWVGRKGDNMLWFLAWSRSREKSLLQWCFISCWALGRALVRSLDDAALEQVECNQSFGRDGPFLSMRCSAVQPNFYYAFALRK